MNKLVMIIEVEDSFDPKLVDPHTIAEDVVTEFNEWADANDQCQVVFVSAEWMD